MILISQKDRPSMPSSNPRIGRPVACQSLPMGVDHLPGHEGREIGITTQAQDPLTVLVVRYHRPPLDQADGLGFCRIAVLGAVAPQHLKPGALDELEQSLSRGGVCLA